jgi:hypothetical protein
MEIAQTGQANIPVRQEWIESITMGQLMIEAAVVMTE